MMNELRVFGCMVKHMSDELGGCSEEVPGSVSVALVVLKAAGNLRVPNPTCEGQGPVENPLANKEKMGWPNGRAKDLGGCSCGQG